MSKGRILVVDDEPDIVRGLTLRLSSEGYQVSGAMDGLGATKKAIEEQPADDGGQGFLDLTNDRVGEFDASLVEDFLFAFAQNGGIDLHVEKRYGRSPHHVVEAIFKGLARALRGAVEIDPRVEGVPSVKGTL